MHALWLGKVPYQDAWRLQREIADLRVRGEIPDTLLLMEHPPTITLGRAARLEHLLLSPGDLERLGIAVTETDRGGDVTYHGPGQLVGYPIFHLELHGRDLHGFLRSMEEALIRLLRGYHLTGRRFPPHTGVWIDHGKIAAIGIKVTRWVTMHGFALNVNPLMEHFEAIVPCGIREHGVTSLRRETGRSPGLQEIARQAAEAFCDVFGTHLEAALMPGRLDQGFSPSSRSILSDAVDLAAPPHSDLPAAG